MATLSQFRQTITSEDLRERFEAACLVSSAFIMAEGAGATDHENRLSWALAVIPDEAYTRLTATKILRWGVATNATLQEQGPSVTDNDIEYILASALGDPTTLALVR